MMRKVSVDASVTFSFEIDDDAVSDWDGAKILEVLEKRQGQTPAVYTPDATLDQILGHLGIMLSIESRTMGNFDGWADFPSTAASGNPYGVDWTIEDVQVES